jgi:hypothetical protein
MTHHPEGRGTAIRGYLLDLSLQLLFGLNLRVRKALMKGVDAVQEIRSNRV